MRGKNQNQKNELKGFKKAYMAQFYKEIWTNKPKLELAAYQMRSYVGRNCDPIVKKFAENCGLIKKDIASEDFFDTNPCRGVKLISKFTGKIEEAEKYYNRQKTFAGSLKKTPLDFSVSKYDCLREPLRQMVQSINNTSKSSHYEFSVYRFMYLNGTSHRHLGWKTGSSKCIVKFDVH